MTHFYHTKEIKATIKSKDFLYKFIDRSLRQHEATIDLISEEPRDFIDYVLLERRKQPNAAHLEEEQVIHVISDLFVAGTDTTTSVLDHTIVLMLLHPDKQKKLMQEIINTFGPEGQPSLEKIHNCNYTQAFIDEVLRFSSVADTSLPHCTSKPEVELSGYKITDDKLILANIWAAHRDPDIWNDPDTFEPERFLNDAGIYKKSDNLLAFGSGPRRCLGEKLARLELFIFIARFAQRVQFSFAPGFGPPHFYGPKQLVRCPSNYEVIIKPLE